MAKANQTPGQELGRKLSVGEFGFSKSVIQKLVLDDQENPQFLVRFTGLAHGTKRYVSGKGEETIEGFGLLGQFRGVSRSGEEKDGSLLYLPGFLTDMIVASLDSDQAVRLAIDVYAAYDEDSATSYVYTARNLIPPDTSALDAINEQIKGMALPSLPAPK